MDKGFTIYNSPSLLFPELCLRIDKRILFTELSEATGSEGMMQNEQVIV
jgi:hypothetical protein